MKKHYSLGRALGGAATLILGLGMFAGPVGAQAAPADTSHVMQGMDHGTMHMQHADSMDMERMMELHMRMMEDPAMRQRMMADTAMHRKMVEMMDHMPAEQRERMMQMMREAEADSVAPPHEHSTSAPAPKPARPATSHGGHPGHTPSM